MDQELKQLYQKVVNLSDGEKVSLGAESAKVVIGYLSNHFDDKEGALIYALLVGNYVGVDSEISPEEYAFCRAVLGFELLPDDFSDVIKNACMPKSIELLDRLIDNAPDDVKVAFVTLGLAICSIDDELTTEEQALLAKYIS